MFALRLSRNYTLKQSNLERTLAMIKPNAVLDKHVGEIISRIEQDGFKIIAIKTETLTKKRAKQFYEIHKNKSFFNDLVTFMTSAPMYALVLEKENAIKAWRNLMGKTNPQKATKNTLRKLYAKNITENATHGSDSPENATKEILFFFPMLKN
jgi:nucleoside-diphosphate kinase